MVKTESGVLACTNRTYVNFANHSILCLFVLISAIKHLTQHTFNAKFLFIKFDFHF